ncbi:hypothetical protein AB1Y20_003632 [Prymnesium parvum]|uniref:PPM-type phosphatase domain-containing protein n=1 Tax=Prymnesium parvum TaxID=97485 RepID=A0AB34J764_PRYPA|mmetsp:Transcript_19001/g.40433  ORF Transcript_19001/g.40433 Transcript_19001/m.40433 type:complete len:387 (+) Transcript_19001:182-1342(+)|eukprot:CAMPEP_0182825180 /NCGR_PEP_ID=MMETSP0006_2-20121128/15694_1 /TAXON_ID=97485 /ORGANISM="Prymnesium parvum, Strain Texoma1" /LENGTH=386 /DNA_ID=CAMNT_0024952243 /DNA_START=132 /DNA_END=1292 /DNA_ORIENTATION=+
MGSICAKRASDPVATASVAPDSPATTLIKGGNGDALQGKEGCTDSLTCPSSKKETFRDRRLSISQQAHPSAPGRRLSVYNGSPDSPHPSLQSEQMSTIGSLTIAGLEPTPSGSSAKINQDRGLAVWPFRGDVNEGLFGVYDGHAKLGHEVSQYVMETLPGIVKAWMLQTDNPRQVLREAYLEVDKALANHMDASVSGTTAVTCYLRRNHIWVANAGDSRAMVCRSSKDGCLGIALSVDHKPDTPNELKRILAMGGYVTPAGSNGSPARVWHNLRGLAMARSIGDHAAATVGVIPDPEITEYDVHDDDVCMVIASDGVWEFLSNEEVANLVYRTCVISKDPQRIVETIVDEASHRWKVEEGDYRDDITVVVLMFPWQSPEMMSIRAT